MDGWIEGGREGKKDRERGTAKEVERGREESDVPRRHVTVRPLPDQEWVFNNSYTQALHLIVGLW